MFAVTILVTATLALILGVLLLDERRRRLSTRPAGVADSIWHGDERRQERRIQTNIPVHYRTVGESANTPASSLDISPNGLCLCLPTLFQKGTELEIELVVAPDKPPQVVRGQVMWVTNGHPDGEGRRIFRTGIAFLQASQDIHQTIRDVYGNPPLSDPPQ